MARKPSLKKQLDKIAEQFIPDIKNAFIGAIRDVTDDSMLTAIIDAIREGDLEKAFRATGLSPAAMRPVSAMIEAGFEAGGVTVSKSFPKLNPADGATIFRFDVRNSRAEAYLRDHSSGLVTRITEQTRTNIQTIVQEGMRDGRNPRNVALDIIGRVDATSGRRMGGIIGLTDQQARYVANARRELTGVPSSAYFERVQRDKRFDKIVQRAIRDQKPLEAGKVDALVGRYSDNLLQLRGETIARTEMLASLAKSQDEAIRQAIDTGTLNPRHVTKKWDATGDKRTRLTHAVMDGQSVGMDEAFTTPGGAKMMFPGDRSLGAPASEIINCRCRVDYDIDFLAGLEGEYAPEPPPAPVPIRPVPAPPPPETPAVRNARLDLEQRDYVLDRGRQQAIEHLSAVDTVTGQVFGRNAGTAGNVTFTPEFIAAITDKNRKIVAHHNHPQSSSFSAQDLHVLTDSPGLKGLWAHGHNGTSYYAEGSRKIIDKNVFNAAISELQKALNAEVRSGGVTPEAINAIGMNHFVLAYLLRRGWLKTYLVEGSEIIANGQPIVDRVLKRLGL